MSMNAFSTDFYRQTGKRILDLALLFLAAPVVIVLSAVIWILIRVDMGPPVLFRQPRPGRSEKIFTLLKFRTMTGSRDAQGRLLPDAQRITPIGRFLRKTSLDEIPGLWNVLRGEMSLVGPRPLLARYLPFFTDEERKRFNVRPGITGWAQIHGRNNLSWDERLQMDAWYVDHQSLWLDLKILWTTLAQVVRGKDVQVVPNLQMPDLDEERKDRQSAQSISGPETAP